MFSFLKSPLKSNQSSKRSTDDNINVIPPPTASTTGTPTPKSASTTSTPIEARVTAVDKVVPKVSQLVEVERIYKITSPQVLYCDHNNIWEPLSRLYLSTTSFKICSRQLESSIEDIVSYYCPSCVTRYMEDEVVLYRNICPNCKDCPMCTANLVVTREQSGYYYSCGYCSWRSSVAVSGPDASKLHESIAGMYKAKAPTNEYKSLVDSYEVVKKKSAPFLKGRDKGESWKISDIEHVVEAKNKNNTSTLDPLAESKLHTLYKNSALTLDDTGDVREASLLTSLEQRLKYTTIQPTKISELLPVPVRNRTKRMVRCRQDVLDGALSIMLQPKAFPLEGDSSHKLQKGKWWVKNSSAVCELPAIVIRKLPDVQTLKKGSVSYLHLTMSNPRQNSVLIKVNPASLDEVKARVPLGVRVTEYSNICWLSSTPKEFAIHLEAEEDELLKDAEHLAALVNSDLAPIDTFSWSILTTANAAKLCLPVVPDKSMTSDKISRDNVYMLNLKIRMYESISTDKIGKSITAEDIFVQLQF